MYHLLLVDDEDITLDRLRSTIRWDTLGIGEVSVAYSMMQAQRIYQAKPVDIMICDIEMPAGSGIDLVRWVRENGYHTLNIFLTAHADFEYIHEALAMQAIEYILKPIAFEEVENAVRKAVALADSASMKSRSDLQLYFEMLLHGSGNSIYRSLQNRSTPLSEDMVVLPVVLFVRQSLTQQSETCAPLSFVPYGHWPLLCDPLDLSGSYVFLLNASCDRDALSEDCTNLWHLAGERMPAAVLCVGEATPVHTLATFVQKMLQRCYATDMEKGVICMRKPCAPAPRPQTADFFLCKTFLEEGNYQKANDYVYKYLHDLQPVSPATLNAFQQNYWEMILKAVRCPEALESLRPHGECTIPALLRWCRLLNIQAVEFIAARYNLSDAIEQAKQYIAAHVYSPIKRSQIASSIHMNEEYLSRIFKKEVGMSLVEYITEVKLKAALNLLEHTQLSISQISVQLGYENFAYFSQLFRSHYQITPSAFRKQLQQDPSSTLQSGETNTH